MSSQQPFTTVDNAIFLAWWQWANRRHPQKSRRWRKDAYFHTIGGRTWVFCGQRLGKKGQPQKVQLFSASQVAIKRHPKIKGAANPFDPAWEIYFEQRRGVTMAENLTGRRKLLSLWKEQGGLCPVCDQPITKLTGWHNHHSVWRTHGGSDRTENRVLLHPNCHRQVHRHGWTVAKPRPARDA